MLIAIDLAEGSVALREPDEFTRFSVLVEGDGDLSEVLWRSGVGRLAADGTQVAVDPAAVRALAGPAADERWEEGFAGMCAYAAGKGWVESDGGVLAHIESGREAG